MRSAPSIQIAFKITPEVADKLEALGTPLRLSRSLVAKELVLASLVSESSGQAIDLFKHRMTAQPALTNGDADQEERATAEDLMQDLIQSSMAQNDVLKYLLIAIEEVKGLRTRDIPLLRTDLCTAVAALLCQAGAPIETAREWVTNNLAVNTPETSPDAKHPANS